LNVPPQLGGEDEQEERPGQQRRPDAVPEQPRDGSDERDRQQRELRANDAHVEAADGLHVEARDGRPPERIVRHAERHVLAARREQPLVEPVVPERQALRQPDSHTSSSQGAERKPPTTPTTHTAAITPNAAPVNGFTDRLRLGGASSGLRRQKRNPPTTRPTVTVAATGRLACKPRNRREEDERPDAARSDEQRDPRPGRSPPCRSEQRIAGGEEGRVEDENACDEAHRRRMATTRPPRTATTHSARGRSSTGSPRAKYSCPAALRFPWCSGEPPGHSVTYSESPRAAQ
jgi:hypothetical protein